MSVDIQKIKGTQFALILFFSVSTIGAGCLFFYLYNEPLFLSLDIVKLILLAVSLTSPMLLFNVVYTYLLYRNMMLLGSLEKSISTNGISKVMDEYAMMRGALMGAFVTLFSYYIPLGSFLNKPLSLEHSIKVVLGINLAYWVVVISNDLIIKNKIRRLQKARQTRK